MKNNLIIFVLFFCLFSFCSLYSPIKALAQDQQVIEIKTDSLFPSFFPKLNFWYSKYNIKFREITLEEAIIQAEKEKKIIFIDFYTNWCAPCKWMTKNILTHKSVADFYNKNFVCLKINADIGKGKEIFKYYNTQVVPSFLFLHKKGIIKYFESGERTVDQFIALGKKALREEVDITLLNTEYRNGNRDQKFLLLYLDVLNSSDLPHQDIVNVFLENQKDLFSKTSWIVIKKYLWDKKSKYYKFLTENKSKYKTIYGEEVENKIKKIN